MIHILPVAKNDPVTFGQSQYISDVIDILSRNHRFITCMLFFIDVKSVHFKTLARVDFNTKVFIGKPKKQGMHPCLS
jgi:hypothetical protein